MPAEELFHLHYNFLFAKTRVQFVPELNQVGTCLPAVPFDLQCNNVEFQKQKCSQEKKSIHIKLGKQAAFMVDYFCFLWHIMCSIYTPLLPISTHFLYRSLKSVY